MAAFSFSLPTAARWDRPKGASFNASSVHVGGLAQGPDEKRGFAGRVAGVVGAISGILTDMRPSLGKGVPRMRLGPAVGAHKRENDMSATDCAELATCPDAYRKHLRSGRVRD